MAMHRLKKMTHLFMNEKELRDVLLDIDEVRREFGRLLKQSRIASASVARWSSHQSPHISNFMRAVTLSESEYNDAAYHFLEGQAEYYGAWKTILTERTELIDIRNRLNKAEKNARKADKKLQDCSVENQPKYTAEATVAHEEVDRLRAKFRESSLYVQRGIETDLRNAYYQRSESKMKFLKKAAFCEERILDLTQNLKRTARLDEQGAIFTEDFEAPPGPMKNPIWHHGEMMESMVNDDGQLSAVRGVAQRKMEEAIMELNLAFIHAATEGCSTDCVSYFMEKARIAQVAAQQMPEALSSKDDSVILDNINSLTRAVTTAIFSAFGIVQMLSPKDRQKFLQLINQVGEDASLIYRRAIGTISSGMMDIDLQPPCDQLSQSLTKMMSFVDSLNLSSDLRDDLKKHSTAAEQGLNHCQTTLRDIRTRVSAENAQIRDADENLIVAGDDLIAQGISLINQCQSFQTSVRESRSFMTQQEFAVLQRDWDRSIDELLQTIGNCAPVWAESMRKVTLKGEKFVDLQVATTNMAAASAQLGSFLQVTEVEGDEEQREELLSMIQGLVDRAQHFVGLINEVRNAYQSNLPFENFVNLSEDQARNVMLDSQSNILRLENELNRERLRIEQLRNLNYASLKNFAVPASTTTLPVAQGSASLNPAPQVQHSAIPPTQSSLMSFSKPATPSNSLGYSAVPRSSMQYNSPAFPQSSSQYNSSSIPQSSSQYNSSSIPQSSMQYNSSSFPQTSSLPQASTYSSSLPQEPFNSSANSSSFPREPFNPTTTGLTYGGSRFDDQFRTEQQQQPMAPPRPNPMPARNLPPPPPSPPKEIITPNPTPISLSREQPSWKSEDI